MNDFNRTELKLLIEGLDAVRKQMQDDINVDLGGEEYRGLVRLQDRLIGSLEKLPY